MKKMAIAIAALIVVAFTAYFALQAQQTIQVTPLPGAALLLQVNDQGQVIWAQDLNGNRVSAIEGNSVLASKGASVPEGAQTITEMATCCWVKDRFGNWKCVPCS